MSNYLRNYVGNGKKLTYEQLGEEFGVSRQQVSHLLAKPILKWHIERLQSVANLLGMDVHDLFRKCLIHESRKRKN